MDAFITVDIDHISCNNRSYEETNISFDYQDILPQLYKFMQDKDFTIFVRIDNQIRDLFGDYLYVFNLLTPKDNIEIGWHPRCTTVAELYEIYNNNPVVRSMKAVRMDGAVMNNDIMKTLSNMNFMVDSSALPGCVRNDEYRTYDWAETGNSPYHPAVFNYQSSGVPCHRILEVPMTTIIIEAPYDKKPQRRYINPTIRKEIFQSAFLRYCDYLTDMVVVFHPDQLISGYSDDLYEYGMENFAANMELIDTIQPNYKKICI